MTLFQSCVVNLIQAQSNFPALHSGLHHTTTIRVVYKKTAPKFGTLFCYKDTSEFDPILTAYSPDVRSIAMTKIHFESYLGSRLDHRCEDRQS